MDKLFESWCPKRQEKLLVRGMTATAGHESAGVIMGYAGAKFSVIQQHVVEGQRVDLHVCKHCGCVFAQPKGA